MSYGIYLIKDGKANKRVKHEDRLIDSYKDICGGINTFIITKYVLVAFEGLDVLRTCTHVWYNIIPDDDYDDTVLWYETFFEGNGKKFFFVLRLIVVTLCKFLLENFSYSCDKIELSHPMRNNAMRQLAGFYGDVKFISFLGLLAMNKNLLG